MTERWLQNRRCRPKMATAIKVGDIIYLPSYYGGNCWAKIDTVVRSGDHVELHFREACGARVSSVLDSEERYVACD